MGGPYSGASHLAPSLTSGLDAQNAGPACVGLVDKPPTLSAVDLALNVLYRIYELFITFQ